MFNATIIFCQRRLHILVCRSYRHLIEEANALFLSLQKKYNGVLGADEFDTGELHDLETEYRVKLRAIQRMHRRFEAWEWIHKTVERARKRLEQAQSEFVN